MDLDLLIVYFLARFFAEIIVSKATWQPGSKAAGQQAIRAEGQQGSRAARLVKTSLNV